MSDKPAILLANGDHKARAVLARDVSALGYKVRATDDLSMVIKWVKNQNFALVILDVDLFDTKRNGFDVLQEIGKIKPQCPVIALGGENTILSSLLAARFGAIDFFARPYSFSDLATAITNSQGKSKPTSTTSAEPIIGKSKAMQPVLRAIRAATGSNLPLVITGAPGTGKFLAASMVAKYSSNKHRALICLHPSSQFSKIDEINSNTTLLLRSLHRFDQAVQFKLCDWFDANEQDTQPVRIIATFSDPHKVETELLARLNVLQIQIPSLSDRREDIVDLATEFLGNASQFQKTLAEDAANWLQTLPWKGNVRELKNLIYQAANKFQSIVLTAEQIDELLNAPLALMPSEVKINLAVEEMISAGSSTTHLYKIVILAVEKPLLEQVLKRVNGNQFQAAKLLGINRNTLRKKMIEHGLLLKK